jgi:hypothetical protein
MAKATLFEATKNSVVIEGVVVRDGLTKGQAKTLALRLNGRVEEATKDFKPTSREQKFSVHFEGDFDFTTYEEGTIYTNKDIVDEVKSFFKGFDPVEGDYVDPKVKVKVNKLYDKQVPND